MTGLDNLRSLACGNRPMGEGLLGNTRFAWGQEALLGEESILASFTASPFSLDEDMLCVETPLGAALVGADHALVADLYSSRIGRIWRVGGEIACDPGQAVDVAFDTDMRQERGDLNFRPEDHPCLAPEVGEKLLAASRQFIDLVRRSGKLRVRGFIVRAFGDERGSVALLSMFTLGNESRRSASFDYAVIGIQADGEVRTICAHSEPKDWTPRL